MSDFPVYPILAGDPDLAALLPTAGGFKIYPGMAPQDTVPPYIVYDQSGNDPLQPMTERADAESQRFSLFCWAEKRADADHMADLARAAFERANNGRPLGFLAMGKTQDFDPDTRTWCVSFDWSGWVNR